MYPSVGEMRKAVSEVRDRRDAADRFERAFLFQFFADEDRIDTFELSKSEIIAP